MSNNFVSIIEKKFSSSAGNIIVTDSDLPDLLMYDEESKVDASKDGDQKISMLVATKSFTFDVGMIRGKEIPITYQKEAGEDIDIEVENIDAGSNTWTDEADSIRENGSKTLRLRIDRMTGIEKYFNAMKIILSGFGLEKLSEMKILGRVEDRGLR